MRTPGPHVSLGVRPERYRTSFALVHNENGEEACIACLACERICPSRIITVKPSGMRESPVTGKKRNYLFDRIDTLDKIHRPSLVAVTRAAIRIVESTAGISAKEMRG